MNTKDSNNPYVQHGYADRKSYLKDLSLQYGVALMVVESLADMLGPNEDFDGLVNALEDM